MNKTNRIWAENLREHDNSDTSWTGTPYAAFRRWLRRNWPEYYDEGLDDRELYKILNERG